MADAKRELAGDVVAYLVRMIPKAVWSPADVLKIADLNPFHEQPEMSEAMRKHLEGWKRDEWRAMVRSNDAGR